jgi:hypothetical protein
MGKVRGMKGRRNFQGCIRNVRINDKEQKISPMMAGGNVEVGVCSKS